MILDIIFRHLTSNVLSLQNSQGFAGLAVPNILQTLKRLSKIEAYYRKVFVHLLRID